MESCRRDCLPCVRWARSCCRGPTRTAGCSLAEGSLVRCSTTEEELADPRGCSRRPNSFHEGPHGLVGLPWRTSRHADSRECHGGPLQHPIKPSLAPTRVHESPRDVATHPAEGPSARLQPAGRVATLDQLRAHRTQGKAITTPSGLHGAFFLRGAFDSPGTKLS